MKYKTIKNFLLNYNESSWSRLIPSLLEIAILNLHISFKTYFFSEKDLENIINDLKSNFKKKLRNNEISNNRNLDEIILEKSNKEYEDRNKRRKNKSREREIDEDDIYERDDIKKKKSNNKSNYAISYDKNLRPEIIEKKDIKNKKGGKIIKRMTEEEYNAQYDSQGEEREIKKKKNKKKKRSKSKNYKKEQIPDQDVQEFNNFNNNDYQQNYKEGK